MNNSSDNKQLLEQQELIEHNNTLIQDNQVKMEFYENECRVLKLLMKQYKSNYCTLQNAKAQFGL